MKSIVNGKVFYKGKFNDGLILVFDEKIKHIFNYDRYITYKKEYNTTNIETNIETNGNHTHINEFKILEEMDAKGDYVCPGFIDVHIHGYKGVDVMDKTVESLINLSENLAKNGITAYLPTTMTMEKSIIEEALSVIRYVKNANDSINPNGAIVLGAHLEGPFINEKFKGAQLETYIVPPDRKLVQRYIDVIKVITIAPEVEGAKDLIEEFSKRINFSLGHSGADYEEAMDAFQKGANSVTHLFNAMTGLHQRAPGIVGAAFNSDCYCELIADKFHIHPALFQMIVKMKGLEKLLLVTDCMSAGGLEEGNYQLGGQGVTLRNNQCTLENGTIAGSVLKLNEGLGNFLQNIEQSLEEIIPLVSGNQAEYLKVSDIMGTIEVGKLANIVIMDKDVSINKTLVRGKLIYENQL